MLGQKIFCPNFLEAVPKTQNFCETCPLKSAKLDKDIAKILLLGLKSAKYRQEYRDFEALKSAKIIQT